MMEGVNEQTGSVPRSRASPGQDGPWWYGQTDGSDGPHGHWPRRRHHWRRGPGRWALRPRKSGPLRRVQEDRLAGGVAAGIAARTGLDVTVIRVVFVLAALAGGFGAAAYVVAWLLIPAEGEDGNIASRALADRRGIALAAGLASLLAVVFVIASVFGAKWLSTVAWPLIISAAGLVLISRNASAPEQESLRRVAEPLGLTGHSLRFGTAVRVAIAIVLLVAGLSSVVSAHESIKLLQPLVGVVLVVAAIAVVLGPWWLRIARDLVIERQARIRAEERADMASRVHDSVLQTLALIQRNAEQPQQVIQLARAQERELRSWLFDGRAPGSLDGKAQTVADGVRIIQQEVEAQHGIAVEAVTVGDCDLDDDLGALLAAAREATVNAAKWSGAPVVSLFTEVEPGQVSVYVRDRGRGFDPAAVSPDRKGLAESIHARMARRGGSAAVRSVPGEGTEVSLTMPRAAGERQPSQA
jgi:signal transduction histidine kinase/phage shock protein PspC (stress-responsive transcriptional regulator)